jgi:thiol-disulfide isomerase/thioredoxin
VKPLLTLLLSFALLSCTAFTGCTDTPSGGFAGKPAPDFTVNDAGKNVSLRDYRGKIVLLNFWATWCPPCVQELPSLVRLQQQLGNKATIMAVSVDVDEGAYKKFVASHDVPPLTLRGSKDTIDQLYSPTGYPESYVVDRNGTIRRKFIGPQRWDSQEFIDYLSKL